MDIACNFGETLTELIFDKKITVDELSSFVNIDVSVIRRYLRKECIPTLPNAILLADYFYCSLDYMFGLSPENVNARFNKSPLFALRFKELLEMQSITRYRICKDSKLSKDTKLSEQSVDDWYHGKHIPTIDSALKLMKYFHCSMDFLVGRED